MKRTQIQLDERTYEELRRRSKREALVKEITAKISHATYSEQLLSTALDELRTTLGASSAHVIGTKSAAEAEEEVVDHAQALQPQRKSPR